MDEVRTVRRLVNLTPMEDEELEGNQEKHMDEMKVLISTYDRFENEKVKAGRLSTLHDNFVYKINFAYIELHKTTGRVKESYEKLVQDGVSVSPSLQKMVEKFLSENEERKEYRS